MEVKGISQKIFRTKSSSVENNSTSNHTNPFGVNFKGNMINADVFDVSRTVAKETIAQKAVQRISSAKNKLADAMKVGSINSFVSSKVKAVVDFGKRVKEGASRLWEKAQNYEIEFPVYENLKQAKEYSQASLLNKSTDKLKSMLLQDLATPKA